MGPPSLGVAEPGAPHFRSSKLSKEMGGWNCKEKELESYVAHLCPQRGREEGVWIELTFCT